MKLLSMTLALAVTVLSLFWNGHDSREADDCSLEFLGQSRKAMKLRSEATCSSYRFYNGGVPITLAQWFRWTSSLDQFVPSKLDRISDDAPIAQAETYKVTLEGYIVFVRYEHADGFFQKDNDLHVELAATPEWRSDHVIIEIPPGTEFCEPRELVWDLVKKDAASSNESFRTHDRVLTHPVKVRATGYVFLDAHHADVCDSEPYSICNGGRGFRIHNRSEVKGLWEIHPVIDVAIVP